MSNTFTIGDESSFHITVHQSFVNDNCFDITVWASSYGSTVPPEIRDRDKAFRIAQFLYNELLPEHVAKQERQKADVKRFDEERAARPKPKPARVLKNAPVFEVLMCPECEEPFEEDSIGEPVYECSNCGTKGVGEDARRCSECSKFTAKQSDASCPECEEGIEVSDCARVNAQRDTSGEIRVMEAK
jgi:hypothetical protein